MTQRKTITDRYISRLKPGVKRLTMPDPELRGHYVRITPKGAKSFVAVARDLYGKQIWATIGRCDVLTVTKARKKARKAIERIKNGLEPFGSTSSPRNSFGAVAENWMRWHVRPKGLRSQPELGRILVRYIYPVFRDRGIESIKRLDVTKLLDKVEDGSGPRQADCVLGVLRGVMNWHATQAGDYVPPIVRGMGRVNK